MPACIDCKNYYDCESRLKNKPRVACPWYEEEEEDDESENEDDDDN